VLQQLRGQALRALLMPHKKEINFAFNILEHLSFMC
jgi:hypothetical protein